MVKHKQNATIGVVGHKNRHHPQCGSLPGGLRTQNHIRQGIGVHRHPDKQSEHVGQVEGSSGDR